MRCKDGAAIGVGQRVIRWLVDRKLYIIDHTAALPSSATLQVMHNFQRVDCHLYVDCRVTDILARSTSATRTVISTAVANGGPLYFHRAYPSTHDDSQSSLLECSKLALGINHQYSSIYGRGSMTHTPRVVDAAGHPTPGPRRFCNVTSDAWIRAI